ncbi:hypothetical protein QLH51_05875 [Sphingomonas sp. 2R-10]|nr:hypothetical protein [Sphingomonas sp. 2R-10]
MSPWLVAAALALGLAGCGSAGEPRAENTAAVVPSVATIDPVEPAPASPVAMPDNATGAPPSTRTPGEEAPAAQVEGRWQVIDAAGPASGRAMIGRTLSFTDTALGWVGADGKVEAGCPDPFYHVVIDPAHLRNFAPAFAVGWPKFALPADRVGAMHVWECGDADSIFGPAEPAAGSAFFPVGGNRLVMNWNDGTVLLLRRPG